MNEIGSQKRKKYDYERLEEIYLQHMQSNIDDADDFERIKSKLSGENIVVLAAGKSIVNEKNKILDYIRSNNAKVISINYEHEDIPCDYIYISNIKRYQNFNTTSDIPIICTSTK